MQRTDYLSRIERAQCRHEAADFVRAFGLRSIAQTAHCSHDDVMARVDRLESHAAQLERDLVGDDGAPVVPHPWRRWLFEWGYINAYTQSRPRSER